MNIITSSCKPKKERQSNDKIREEHHVRIYVYSNAYEL